VARGDSAGVVIAMRPRHSSRAQCSCGWIGRSHMLLSSAKIDALIHATKGGCQPAIPLAQSETAGSFASPEVLTVECPGGCGESLSVPLVIVSLTAEAPELHDLVYKHLRRCPSARSWADTALHDVPIVRPKRRTG
jgi:hypothetical protein